MWTRKVRSRLRLSRLRGLRVGLLMVGAGMCARAEATAASAAPPSYSIRVWSREQGLPQNTVNAITQDRAGYLWIGTFDGIARFDGARFKRLKTPERPRMHSSRVTCLYTARDGRLWVGHETGAISELVDGELVQRSPPMPLEGVSVIGLTETAAGTLWAVLGDGRAMEVRSQRMLLPPASAARPGGEVIYQPLDDGFAINCSGHVFIWTPTELATLPVPASPAEPIYGMARSRQGGWWIATGGRLRRASAGQWVQDLGPTPWPAGTFASSLLEMADGSVAAGTLENGLYIVNRAGGVEHLDRNTGLPDSRIRSLAEDSEGNLWLGAGHALVALRPALFRQLSLPEEAAGHPVLAVAPAADGGLWVGTEGAFLQKYSSGRWQRFGPEDGLPNPNVWSVLDDAAGNTWVGTWGGGLLRRNKSGPFVAVPGIQPSNPVLALAREVGTDAVWVGTRAGPLRFASGEALFPVQYTFPADVRALAPFDEHEAWVGTLGRGIALMSPRALQSYTEANGLPGDLVEAILRDDDGTVWIGTSDRGLVRFRDGRFSTIDHRNGLPGDSVGHMLDDGYGAIWLSTRDGLLRVLRRSLEACADRRTVDLEFRRFGLSDGLHTLECMGGQAAACKTPDGRLWFAMTDGVVSVDPRDVTVDENPLPVVFESTRLDGVEIAVASRVVVPPGVRRIEIEFTGLSLTDSSDVRFRYRLGPGDAIWTDLGTQRSLGFSHLAPGEYTLEVVACSRDHVWGSAPAQLQLAVQPSVWQSKWTRLGAASLLIATAMLIGRWVARQRMQRRLEDAQRSHQLEKERTRIARDIHDDLGASLTRIAILSQTSRSTANVAELESAIGGISSTASALTRAMDEIVWAINPRYDQLDSLVSYLVGFAGDFLRSGGMTCSFDVPVELPALVVGPETRHNLYLTLKELLNNLVKHAQAREVRVAIRFDAACVLSLQIVHDGTRWQPSPSAMGVSSAPARGPGGHGMHNIAERVQEMGATLAFGISPEGLNETTLRVPFPGNPPDS